VVFLFLKDNSFNKVFNGSIVSKRIVCFLMCLSLILQHFGFAQVIARLNIAPHFSAYTLGSDNFRPLHLRWVTFNHETNNFRLFLDKASLNSGHTILNS
jgi:hypothetical protein